MNNNATSVAYILEIDWVMLYLVFGGHFFWQKKLQMVIMNYHAKSGAYSLTRRYGS